MAYDVTKFEVRPLSKEESLAISGQKDSAAIVDWLVRQFSTIPDRDEKGEVIMNGNGPKVHEMQVGEGIEIGPFESEKQATNFSGYYTSDAAKRLNWGRMENGRTSVRTKSTARQRDGKWYLWIIRKS